MDDVAVECVDHRVGLLEKVVIGKESDGPAEGVSSFLETISDKLSSSLEFREKLEGLIKLTPFLEEIVDQSLCEKDSKNLAKECALLARLDELKSFVENCSRIADLRSVLDTEEIGKAAMMKGRILEAHAGFRTMADDYAVLRRRYEHLYLTYDTLIFELSKSIVALDAEVRRLEEKL